LKKSQNQAVAKANNFLKIPELSSLSLHEAADVFLSSEEFYVQRGLRLAYEGFQLFLVNSLTLKREILTQKQIDMIFLNLSNLYDFHTQMRLELFRVRMLGVDVFLEHLGKTMLKFIPFFKLYTQYVQSYKKAYKYLIKQTDKKPNLKNFLDLHEMTAGLQLQVLLLIPVTRLPQYLNFLGAIHTRITNKQSQASIELFKAIGAILSVTESITFHLRDETRRKLVVNIQLKDFKASIDVISPSRYVVKHGELTVIYDKTRFHARKKVQLFVLFNDCLLFGKGGKAKHVMRFENMTVAECPDGKDFTNAIMLKSTVKEKTYTLCASTPEQRKLWFTAMKTQIDLYNGEDKWTGDPKTFEAVLLKKAKKGTILDTPTPTNHMAVRGAASALLAQMGPGGAGSTTQRVSVGSTSGSTTQPMSNSTPLMEKPSTDGSASGECVWVKQWDETSGQCYWANPITMESTWDCPPDYVDEEEKDASTLWTEVVDETSGEFYYVNLSNNKVQWEKPAELGGPEPEPTLPLQVPGPPEDITVPGPPGGGQTVPGTVDGPSTRSR